MASAELQRLWKLARIDTGLVEIRKRAAALDPGRDEAQLAQTLRRLSPSATPNPRLVAIANALLGRQGRMVSAIAAIGRGADAFEGTPFCLPLKAPVA